FKRVLHPPTGDKAPKASAEEKERGFLAFCRDWMRDVYSNDRPLPDEQVKELSGSAFAGEYEPITVSLWPLRDLGRVSLTVTDLRGPAEATISSRNVEVGYVQHRIARVTAEGSVYTIEPRLIIPRDSAAVPAGLTRTFWLTVRVPADASAGAYRGTVRLR